MTTLRSSKEEALSQPVPEVMTLDNLGRSVSSGSVSKNLLAPEKGSRSYYASFDAPATASSKSQELPPDHDHERLMMEQDAASQTQSESPPRSTLMKLWISLKSPESLKLLLLILATIFVSAFDWVLWKRTLNKFHSKKTDETYSFFVLQLYIIMEFVLAFSACMFQVFVTKVITPAMRNALPLRVLAGIASLDTISMLLSSLAAAVVAGHVQTLLNQMSLPILMVFSLIFLAARYSKLQYIGALLIVGGAVLAAIPNVTSKNADGRENKAWGLITYSISLIPFALSNVYREVVFRDRPKIDIFYLMAWGLALQFVFGWVCVPILAIPAFGGVPLKDVPNQVSLGYECLMGREVDGLECHIGTKPVWFLTGYVVLNFVVSILRLLLIKTASAVILQVTNAMALLTSNIIFCSALFMGKDKEEFNIFDAFGLVIVVTGFVLFRIAQYQMQEERLLDESSISSETALTAETSETSEQDTSPENTKAVTDSKRSLFGTPLRSERRQSRSRSRVGLEDTNMSFSTGTGVSRHSGGHSRLLDQDELEDRDLDCALRKAAVSASFGTVPSQPVVHTQPTTFGHAGSVIAPGSAFSRRLADSDDEV